MTNSRTRKHAKDCFNNWSHKWRFVLARGDSTGRRWAYYSCQRCGTSDRREGKRFIV